jgi:8-oxo-dGTP pyrophosphatase MutT (NUDIX family)
MRRELRADIAAIEPLDELEREHIADVIDWIDSGVELCRIMKPATPAKHLVSYFVLVDAENVLLVDHKNAQLWLPTGGHVEPGEHPRSTVARELREELGVELEHPLEPPLLVTCSTTVGLAAGHTDVSLWYVVNADRRRELHWDKEEFNSVQWFTFSQTRDVRSDPHLGRFLEKLTRQRFKKVMNYSVTPAQAGGHLIDPDRVLLTQE